MPRIIQFQTLIHSLDTSSFHHHLIQSSDLITLIERYFQKAELSVVRRVLMGDLV